MHRGTNQGHAEGGCTRQEDEVQLNHYALPKLSFSKFSGENPRIWIDKCYDYFYIFNIPDCMWTTAASLHMEDVAAKWLKVYKLKHGLGSSPVLLATVEQKFGAYGYRQAVQDLLALRQVGPAEEYTKEFEAA
jgi:hypothetical protein